MRYKLKGIPEISGICPPGKRLQGKFLLKRDDGREWPLYQSNLPLPEELLPIPAFQRAGGREQPDFLEPRHGVRHYVELWKGEGSWIELDRESVSLLLIPSAPLPLPPP